MFVYLFSARTAGRPADGLVAGGGVAPGRQGVAVRRPGRLHAAEDGEP